jgi:hypothetical protein
MKELSLVGLGLCYLEDVLSALNSAAHRLQSTSDINSIESLLLHGNRLQSLASSSSLSSSFRLPHLIHLNISSNELNALDFADLSGSPELESLDVAANRINSVRNLALLPRLSTINLSYNSIDSLSFLEDIRGGTFSNITSLDLRDNMISRLSELLALRNVPKLVDLRLQSAEIVGIQSTEISSNSTYRIRSNASNPVCMDPDYFSTILASCPLLETLDTIPIKRWKLHIGKLEKQPNPHLYDIPQSNFNDLYEQNNIEILNVSPSIDVDMKKIKSTIASTSTSTLETFDTPKLDVAANRFIKRFLTDPEATAAIAAAVVAASSTTPSNKTSPTTKHLHSDASSLDIQSRFESLEAKLALLTADTQLSVKTQGLSPPSLQSPPSLRPPRFNSPGESRDVSTGTSPVRTKVAESSTIIETKDSATNTEDENGGIVNTKSIKEEEEEEEVLLLSKKLETTENALQIAIDNVQRLSKELEISKEENEKEALVIGEYRNRIGDLEGQIVSLPSVSLVETFRAKIRDLEVDLDHISTQYKNARIEVNDQDLLLKKTKIAINEITTERDTLTVDVVRLSTEVTSLKALLASEKELKLRVEEASRLSGEQMAVSVTNAMVRARDAEQSMLEERKHSEDAHRENVRLSSDLATAKADLENWRIRATEAVARGKTDVQSERERAMQAIGAAEERLTSARAAAEDEVRRVTREANVRLASARSAIDQHALKQSGVHKTISEMKAEMEDVKAKLIFAQNDAAESKRLSQTLKDALKASEAKCSLCITEAESNSKMRAIEYSKSLESLEGTLKSTLYDRDELRSEKERLINEVRVKEVQLTDTMETIRKLKRELETLKEETHANDAGLEDAIADLKAQLEDIQSARDAEHLEWEEERAASSTANQRASDFEEQAQAARRVAAQLENVLREVRLEAASMEEKLKKQIAEKEATLSFVDKEVSQLKKAFDDKNAHVVIEKDKALALVEETKKALLKEEERNKMLEQLRAESIAEAEATAADAVKVKETSEIQIDHARRRVAAVEAEMRVVLRELDAAKAQGAEQSKKLKIWLDMIPSTI